MLALLKRSICSLSSFYAALGDQSRRKETKFRANAQVISKRNPNILRMNAIQHADENRDNEYYRQVQDLGVVEGSAVGAVDYDDFLLKHSTLAHPHAEEPLLKGMFFYLFVNSKRHRDKEEGKREHMQ